jgi:hypothetical protein
MGHFARQALLAGVPTARNNRLCSQVKPPAAARGIRRELKMRSIFNLTDYNPCELLLRVVVKNQETSKIVKFEILDE